ncbi:cell division protein FtsQ/DivIB [Eilatimonas milleporae]|uniref:Cell division protein FtsQ n=1 Tax=Eilatimonas milleporae TaxID=911205 RepID=A0A3M0D6W4_9PROT|nr:cell division protein FtsQ/DivIB [Eilatimonas milleporae]RMB12013.1 cell division protein FtsQ [Eilatimonas milleporae]
MSTSRSAVLIGAVAGHDRPCRPASSAQQARPISPVRIPVKRIAGQKVLVKKALAKKALINRALAKPVPVKHDPVSGVAIKSPWLKNLLPFGVMLGLIGLVTAVSLDRTGLWMVEASREAGFILRSVDVDGAARTSQQDIMSVLDIDTGMPMFAIDIDALKTRLEGLSWVKQAVVQRHLPGGLSIRLVEREPFALWQQGGRVRLVDADGVVIDISNLTPFAGHMLLVGEGAPEEIGALKRLMDAAPGLAPRIQSAVRVSGRRWDLVFDNGVRLKLPEDGGVYPAADAFARFIRLEEQYALLAREISVIDMRLADRLVMRVTPAGRRVMDGIDLTT